MKYTIQKMEDGKWLVKYTSSLTHEEEYLGATDTLLAVANLLAGEKAVITEEDVAKNLTQLSTYVDSNTRAIECIKVIRNITGCGLREAKNAYDRYTKSNY